MSCAVAMGRPRTSAGTRRSPRRRPGRRRRCRRRQRRRSPHAARHQSARDLSRHRPARRCRARRHCRRGCRAISAGAFACFPDPTLVVKFAVAIPATRFRARLGVHRVAQDVQSSPLVRSFSSVALSSGNPAGFTSTGLRRCPERQRFEHAAPRSRTPSSPSTATRKPARPGSPTISVAPRHDTGFIRRWNRSRVPDRERPRPSPGKRASPDSADSDDGETRTRTGDTTIFRQMLRTLEPAAEAPANERFLRRAEGRSVAQIARGCRPDSDTTGVSCPNRSAPRLGTTTAVTALVGDRIPEEARAAATRHRTLAGRRP